MRLDKKLANSGYGTRSEIKTLISKGQIAVNGTITRDSGFKVANEDEITINGHSISTTDYLYFVFDKPDCVATAMEDKRLECVGDFIPKNLKGKHLSPVGRLDYHTTGILIITNDGDLNHKLTSPKYKIPKTYKVEYEGDLFAQDVIDDLAKGITLTDMDKPVKLAPAKAVLPEDHVLLLTLTEGKTHEVRRIVSHYGRTVKTLRRISIGSFEPTDLESGDLRELTDDELKSLQAMF